MPWLIDFGSSGYVALYHFDAQYIAILAVRHRLAHRPLTRSP